MLLMGLDKGSTESKLFCCIFAYLSIEINNIKAGLYYIGKVLLNHFVCWWYLCVLSKCTWVAKLSTIDVFQYYAESHEILYNDSNTVSMMFKAKSAKSTVIPLLPLGGQIVKSVDHNKYLGLYWIPRS